ncbi:hypothetical protein SK128_025461, partial [Halocaridina rubra]
TELTEYIYLQARLENIVNLPLRLLEALWKSDSKGTGARAAESRPPRLPVSRLSIHSTVSIKLTLTDGGC